MKEEKVVINKERLFNIFKDGINESKTIISSLFGDADNTDDVSEIFYKEMGTHIDSIYKKIIQEVKPFTKETESSNEKIKEFWGEK